MAHIEFPLTHPVINSIRGVAQEFLLHPLLNMQVHGQENLEIITKESPVIMPYAPHNGHGDSIVVAHMLRESGITDLAIPGGADYWFTDPKRLVAVNLFLPAFPLPRPDKAEAGLYELAGVKKAIRMQLDLINNHGLSLFLAVEGTRTNLRPEERKFMPGFAFLALEAGIPIIPITIVGYETVLPKGTNIPHPFDRKNPGLDKRKKIDVVFGEPIYTTGINNSYNRKVLTTHLQNVFVETYYKYAKQN